MPIELDFVADFVDFARKDLVANGFVEAADRSKLPDDEVGIRYFNVVIRMIQPRPRKVKFAPKYATTFPKTQSLAVHTLIRKIRAGKDLTPHQTRAITERRLIRNDKMLNDWSIHHLHPTQNGGDDVLMCHVTDDVLYAIGFWPHKNWVNTEIVTELVDTWPEEFDKKTVNSSGGSYTQEELQNLRDKNAMTFFTHPVTKKVYYLGGGLTTAGTNVSATTEYDRVVYILDGLESRTRRTLEASGITGDGRLILEFRDGFPWRLVTETGEVVPVSFPDGFASGLPSDEKPFGHRRPPRPLVISPMPPEKPKT